MSQRGNIFRAVGIALLPLGGLLVGVSFFVSDAPDGLLVGVGGGLVTGGLFDLLFHGWFGDRMREGTEHVVKELQGVTARIEAEVSRVATMFEGAQYVGLQAVLPPRLDAGQYDEANRIMAKDYTRRYIEKHLGTIRKRAGQLRPAESGARIVLKIAGISASEYLHLDQTYYPVLHELARDRDANAVPIEVRVLIMDPLGDAANTRTLIERNDPKVMSDIESSLIGARSFASHKHPNPAKFTMNVKFADYSPQAYLLITPLSLFVEQYHFASKIAIESRTPHLPGLCKDANPCGGGRVPILEFGSESAAFVAMDAHFDALFDGAPELREIFVWEAPSETYEELNAYKRTNGSIKGLIEEKRKIELENGKETCCKP